jgi:predicted nucleic acid-binding protein
MLVISDTTPINYLVLIGEQELLPALFGQVVIPEAVLRELQAPATPQAVREWVARSPPWLVTRRTAEAPDPGLSHLHEGEGEAIQLAQELGADLLLLDEKPLARKQRADTLQPAGRWRCWIGPPRKGWLTSPRRSSN